MDRCLRFINIVRKKKLTDVSLFLLLSVSIAVYSYVNIFYILPYMYQQLLSVWWMMVHVLPMAFVFFNLIANFIAIIHADSSILGRLLPLPTLKKNNITTTYCYICQCDIPPRCWHCDMCDICILTRDHHCAFTTTCVGHYNRRYFLWFLLYFSMASFYEIILISYYTYNNVHIRLSDLMVVLWPIPSIIAGFRLNTAEICVLLLVFSLLGAIMSSLLLVYHWIKVFKGQVCHENHEKYYDFGLVQNLEIVFGEKWHITWISPLVKSKLPYNGLDWQNHTNQHKID